VTEAQLTPATEHPPRLSACVITFNEEERIAGCIESLTWCDELLVVDSHSTDATRVIAEQLGARVIERDWPGFGPQKEFAIRAATHDWVLCLDADERVSPALREEIVAVRASGFTGAVGYEFPRLSWYLGAWVRHGVWYPNRCLRLFDRRHGRWGGSEPHMHVDLDARPVRLRHPLQHYPYRTLSEHLAKIDGYTTVIARERFATGRRANVLDLLLRPPAAFIQSYVLKRGFLDGWRGLLVAALHAHYVRMKYAKLLLLDRKLAEQQ
jgi:glycosyltransferase involved in cell wall biosynthesis